VETIDWVSIGERLAFIWIIWTSTTCFAVNAVAYKQIKGMNEAFTKIRELEKHINQMDEEHDRIIEMKREMEYEKAMEEQDQDS